MKPGHAAGTHGRLAIQAHDADAEEALLVERYPTQPIALANEGLGGEKVVDSASRFGSALATHQPECTAR